MYILRGEITTAISWKENTLIFHESNIVIGYADIYFRLEGELTEDNHWNLRKYRFVELFEMFALFVFWENLDVILIPGTCSHLPIAKRSLNAISKRYIWFPILNQYLLFRGELTTTNGGNTMSLPLTTIVEMIKQIVNERIRANCTESPKHWTVYMKQCIYVIDWTIISPDMLSTKSIYIRTLCVIVCVCFLSCLDNFRVMPWNRIESVIRYKYIYVYKPQKRGAYWWVSYDEWPN